MMVSNDTIIVGGDSQVASSEEICKILADMRSAIDQNKFQPINRRKNIETLARMGLTWQDAKSEIYELEEKDYRGGPKEDRDRPESDMLWVFKKKIDGYVLYIKFKVVYLEDGRVKVVSFHFDGD